MRTDAKMVMTVRVNKKLATAFSSFMEEIGLRRDVYLNKLLPDEVERLSKLPPHSERAAKYARLNWQMLPEKDARLSLKLDTSLVNRITEVCREKGIPRDQFIETFIDFLVNGFEGTEIDPFSEVTPPLAKAYELITDPYWEANGELNIYEPLHLDDTQFEKGVFKLFLDDVSKQRDKVVVKKGGK